MEADKDILPLSLKDHECQEEEDDDGVDWLSEEEEKEESPSSSVEMIVAGPPESFTESFDDELHQIELMKSELYIASAWYELNKIEYIDEQVDPGFDPNLATPKNCEIARSPVAELVNLNDSIKAKCTVCLQSADIPVQLPCEHVFCLTCLKGLLRSTSSCAICKIQVEPSDFISNPEKFAMEPLFEPIAGLLWFYKSQTGWWAHSPRMQIDLERAFQKGQSTLECLFNGLSCEIDLKKFIQTFRKDPPRTQEIRRVPSGRFPSLGVAGLRYQVPK